MSRPPNGAWFLLGNVPHEANAEDLRTFLEAGGIRVPVENICMKKSDTDYRCAAIVCLPPEEIATLVERALLITDLHLMGRTLRVVPTQGR